MNIFKIQNPEFFFMNCIKYFLYEIIHMIYKLITIIIVGIVMKSLCLFKI